MIAPALARRPGLSRSAMAAAALLIAVAALAVATGLLLVRVQAARAAQQARTAAVAAARRSVPALLSYSYQAFRTDLAHAEADATGGFRATYRRLMSGQVGPAAMASHVVTRATVSGASVIGAAPGTATLLLFVSEQTKSDARQAAVLNDTAVRVTMREVNGNWLVAGLVPRS